MPLYTVLIEDRAVLVFAADTLAEAETLLAGLGAALWEIDAVGVPRWDGKAGLAVRPAQVAETLRWRQALHDAQGEGSAGEDPDDFATLLVEAVDQ
ncbi:hypothetical protein [Paracraurococcus ruber]|uniref:Uncharacterized protein n=1 Tax=Paracraurococcus ruber TaxID=77675 RepID=A0ABS1CRQ4_9PROT|nr:hypothetical protein [Paracraurococcus ruber]MBK1656672.1 hypothetical protein [Paracraurococcus ruber]TDG33709.1 hypothetical protein E2C05_02490 [Paracraurococcus ruber]